MNRWVRFILIVFSLTLAVVFLVTVLMMASKDILSGIVSMIVNIAQRQSNRTVALVIGLLGFLIATFTLIVAVMSGRLRKTRIRSNEIGHIEIGVEAIENIALNAAKISQSGVKMAKAHVSPSKGGALSIKLVVQAFPDVEIPMMMARVQERVKKDIEKYTGIEVGDVQIRVSKVEAISPRVER
ncbi:MAG TPA: alkaline shock response membrane anchor protein AmaP [Clostridiaceae bacterium]|nr:alkaline shock response membrane anchor protein AmaP [Clostridiaceae bacterium]